MSTELATLDRMDETATVQEVRRPAYGAAEEPGLLDLSSDEDVLSEVIAGLSLPQKRLPCKLFYDETGARLFDRISALPEYYLTRTEVGILRRHAGEMAALIGEDCRFVEFGSGSAVKTRLLLDALREPACYVPVDISRAYLRRAAREIARDYPHVQVRPVVGDYMQPLKLPGPESGVRCTCVFFPGSTFGNFERREALQFLRRVRRMIQPAGGFLLGIDLRKEPELIEAAYNDASGITAAFNRNILSVINRRIGADFDPEAFDHLAVYDAPAGRVEMRLVSLCDQCVRIGEERFFIAADEYIITEHSHKYSMTELTALAADTGLVIVREWHDPLERFAVCYLRPRALAQPEPRK